MKTDKRREKIRRIALEENTGVITSRNRNRLAIGFALLLLVIFALILRMGYWQIYKSDAAELDSFFKEIFNEELLDILSSQDVSISDGIVDKILEDNRNNKNTNINFSESISPQYIIFFNIY